jgi:hypothetical protein
MPKLHDGAQIALTCFSLPCSRLKCGQMERAAKGFHQSTPEHSSRNHNQQTAGSGREAGPVCHRLGIKANRRS